MRTEREEEEGGAYRGAEQERPAPHPRERPFFFAPRARPRAFPRLPSHPGPSRARASDPYACFCAGARDSRAPDGRSRGAGAGPTFERDRLLPLDLSPPSSSPRSHALPLSRHPLTPTKNHRRRPRQEACSRRTSPPSRAWCRSAMVRSWSFFRVGARERGGAPMPLAALPGRCSKGRPARQGPPACLSSSRHPRGAREARERAEAGREAEALAP
jgi:hypothetical protein